MKYQAIAANSKIYFGQDIPNMFVEGNNNPSKPVPSSSLPNADADLLRGKPNEHWVSALCMEQENSFVVGLVTEDEWEGR